MKEGREALGQVAQPQLQPASRGDPHPAACGGVELLQGGALPGAMELIGDAAATVEGMVQSSRA